MTNRPRQLPVVGRYCIGRNSAGAGRLSLLLLFLKPCSFSVQT
jgi:hypothetical protein